MHIFIFFPLLTLSRTICIVCCAIFSLSVNVQTFAAQAIYPYTDKDLVDRATNPAFQHVIHIKIRKTTGELSRCSAARTIITSTLPIYVTAAHCLIDAVHIENLHDNQRAHSYIIHPYYEANQLADVAFFTLPSMATRRVGYPIVPSDNIPVMPLALVSVGYGRNEAKVNVRESKQRPVCSGYSDCLRQAFSPGKVKVNEFFISQELESVSEEQHSQRSGVSTVGDSGGPLFMQQLDGTYQIIGVMSYLQKNFIQPTSWATIDSSLLDAITTVFGEHFNRSYRDQVKLDNLTVFARQHMLKNSGKTWDETQMILQRKSNVQMGLGRHYYEVGDYSSAYLWLKKSAEQNDAAAQTFLGTMYEHGLHVAQNDAQAVHWYEKAVAQSNVAAHYRLGRMYENGRGVTRRNTTQAISLYKKAAVQGFAQAQHDLGFMYYDGKEVGRQDWEEAFLWFRHAARQGYISSQHNLGIMYEYGRGVTQDYAEAISWYEKVAVQGDAKAQYKLGIMYEYGRGTVRDAVEALAWYKKAAAQGNVSAQRALEKFPHDL